MIASLTIGSRGSKLALYQSNLIADMIRAHAPNLKIHIEIIKTTGDHILDAPLAKIGGKGLFTKELELALVERRIDLAVHSMKDLPTELPPSLIVGAVPKRATPNDAFVSVKWSSVAELPAEVRVGTSSLRRSSQLRALRSDLVIVDLRGNVDTRLAKVRDGDVDAAILACAGLERLGYHQSIRQVLPETMMVSAVGQGALAIEIREEDSALRALLQTIADPITTLEVTAERAFLGALGGGCQVPIGALARANNDTLLITGCVCALDGSNIFRTEQEGSIVAAHDLGRRAADILLAQGADAVISSIR